MVQSEQQTSVERETIEATRAFARAMVASDPAALDGLLAPGFHVHAQERARGAS